MPTINTRYGEMQVLDANRDMIGRFLASYGEWADLEIRFIADNIEDDATIADIGAFVGTFGIGLSHRRKLRRICFVEGNTDLQPLLRHNVELNCKAESAVVEAFVFPNSFSTRPGRQNVDNIGSLSFAVSNLEGPSQEVSVSPSHPHLTLRQLRETFGAVDLIKLDIEGLELPVLAEEKELLHQGQTSVWAECNESIASLDLAEFLLSCNLKVFFFAFPSFNPENFRESTDPIFPFAYESGLLATPNEPYLAPSLADLGCIFQPVYDREMLRRALWKTPRWAPRQWFSKYPQETVALAMHELNRDKYATFLVGTGQEEMPWPEIEWPQSKYTASSTRLAEAEAQSAALQEALDRNPTEFTSQLFTAKEEIQQLRSANEELERVRAAINEELEQVRTIVSHRLVLLRAEHGLRVDLERQLRIEREHRLAIEQSVSWRGARRLHRIINRVPLAKRVIRKMLMSTWRGLRFLRGPSRDRRG